MSLCYFIPLYFLFLCVPVSVGMSACHLDAWYSACAAFSFSTYVSCQTIHSLPSAYYNSILQKSKLLRHWTWKTAHQKKLRKDDITKQRIHKNLKCFILTLLQVTKKSTETTRKLLIFWKGSTNQFLQTKCFEFASFFSKCGAKQKKTSWIKTYDSLYFSRVCVVSTWRCRQKSSAMTTTTSLTSSLSTSSAQSTSSGHSWPLPPQLLSITYTNSIFVCVKLRL